jgi:hypothetical protein
MKAINIPAMMAIAIMLTTAGCKKDLKNQGTDNYTSTAAFLAANAVSMQHYSVDATAGGNFTSPQGTKVTVAPNSFLTQTGGAVSGAVDISFKDIYNKSDMLLSMVPTMLYYGAPIKSGGEFYIKASQGGSALILTGLQPIVVVQPLNGRAMDTLMMPMRRVTDSIGQNQGIVWAINGTDTLRETPSGYVFSLYTFAQPVDSGSWCNSDNSTYFSAYQQGTLTLTETDTASYGTAVFLVFSGLNSMVHVYEGGQNIYPYSYAPIGLQCTVVAVGTKGGNLYASFTPITISNNQNVNFSLTATTTTDFKNHLNQLNN